MIVFTCPSGLFSALSVSLRMEENHTPLSLPRLSTWYTFPDWNSLVSKKCTFLSGTALMQISLFLMLVICNYFLHMLRRSQGRYIVYLEVNCLFFISFVSAKHFATKSFIGDSLDCILYSKFPYHCTVMSFSLLLYIKRSACTNVMKLHNFNSNSTCVRFIRLNSHFWW